MSEQPPIDQTHGYNAKATEAIRSMPKDEWDGLPIPDETAYNNSQINLENPEVAERSEEMTRWSEKVGAYADGASALQEWHDKKKRGEDALYPGPWTPIEPNISTNLDLASKGVEVMDRNQRVRVVPRADGMEIDRKGSIMFSGGNNFGFVRSPVKIAQDREQQKAVKAAKDYVEDISSEQDKNK